MTQISGKVSFDDERVTHQEFEREEIRRIKMKKNEVIRIAFLSDSVYARPRHFKQGVGYLKCLASQGFCPACIAADQKSVYYDKTVRRVSDSFAANVYVFKSFRSKSDVAAVEDPKAGNIHCFVFGSEKFTSFRSLKQMYGTLVGLDIQITCTDENFQKMSIMAYPREVSYSNNEEWKEWASNLHKYPVEKLIAKEVTPAEMVKAYGINESIMGLISEQIPSDNPMVNMTPNQEHKVPQQEQFQVPSFQVENVQNEPENVTKAQPISQSFSVPSALDEI